MGSFCWPAGERCLAAADRAPQDADGEAGGAAPVLGAREPPPWMPIVSPLLSPFSSRGLRGSSPTSVFPFVVDFSLLSVFLAMLSRFCSPLSLSSFLPR